MSRRKAGANPRKKRIHSKTKQINCSDLGEDQLLRQLLRLIRPANRILNGLGDDCAVVETRDRDLLVLKTDCVVANVHFLPTANAADVGWKAMMRPLSDFAATSAVPRFALVTLIVPAQTGVEWLKGLYRGMRRAAKRFEVGIVGGEMSGTPGPVAISVSVIGFVERNRRVSRRGGRTGDDLFVTGRLGGAVKRKHLKFVPRIVESRWLTRNFSIHAMMDLSDGLGADLPRLAAASGKGFSIDPESLPLSRGASISGAISDGEDYELLFAVSPRDRRPLECGWRRRFPEVPLTRVGRLTPNSELQNSKMPHGYVHFQHPG